MLTEKVTKLAKTDDERKAPESIEKANERILKLKREITKLKAANDYYRRQAEENKRTIENLLEYLLEYPGGYMDATKREYSYLAKQIAEIISRPTNKLDDDEDC